jgi:pSer/pThr/pTyr-binding forkhead associated (FHA) protein
MVYRPPTPLPEPVEEDAPPAEPQREVVTLTVDGRQHEITSPRVVLGRSRSCDVRVSDLNVSRRHAEVRQEGATYWIVDLDSMNGTLVNGQRAERERLRDGDTITLGSTEIVFGRTLP